MKTVAISNHLADDTFLVCHTYSSYRTKVVSKKGEALSTPLAVYEWRSCLETKERGVLFLRCVIVVLLDLDDLSVIIL